ncbi:22728_t:CDS:1, partial [Racocetra persica]
WNVKLLSTISENIVKIVVNEVVQNLRTAQEKQQKHRSRICYMCHCKGYLVYSCLFQKNQVRDRYLNNDCIEVHFIEFSSENYG